MYKRHISLADLLQIFLFLTVLSKSTQSGIVVLATAREEMASNA